jgi:hypothetical protein
MSYAEDQPYEQRNRRILIGFILAVSCGSLLYRLLLHEHLGQTAAMFLGIPAVLAILLALAPKAETATGAILKGITLALLIVAPLLGEGYLCILIAAPLFYVVGIVVGLAADWRREKREDTLMCVAVVLLPFCLEGVVPELTFHRTQRVEVRRIVDGSEEEVWRALARSPRVDATLPRFLRIGFPRPLEARGSGLAPGAARTIHFAGAEGDPPGDLVMRVTESRAGYVRFETVSDGSKLTQWLLWKSSEVRSRAVDRDHTEVAWTIEFDRQLDPAWYFTPWERYAVGKAAAFLIEANATLTKGETR